MALGPVEILCIKFPTAFVKDEIAGALRSLVEAKTIRVIDILFIKKSADGEVTINEVDEVGDIDYSLFEPLIADISGLISDEDVQTIAQSLDNDSFAALMLFENTWATTFRDAILKADGQLLLNARIPSAVIDQVMAAQATA